MIRCDHYRLARRRAPPRQGDRTGREQTLSEAWSTSSGGVSHLRHTFWFEDLGFGDVDLSTVIGHRQVTDAYLAALARHRDGRLATFDKGLAALHPDVTKLVPVG